MAMNHIFYIGIYLINYYIYYLYFDNPDGSCCNALLYQNILIWLSNILYLLYILYMN